MTDKIRETSEARRFLFCHVPRTAGTTIATTLSKVFGIENGAIQAEPRDRGFLRVLADERSSHLFASGHISLPQALRVKRLCPKVVVISSYRDPVRHALSLFLHNKQFPDSRICHDGRNAVDLDELLRTHDPSSLFDANVLNVMTRVYSGRSHGALSRADLNKAYENSKGIDFLFNSACLQRDLSTFCARYGLPLEEIPLLNSNPFHSEEALDDEMQVLLQRVQGFDIELIRRITERNGCDKTLEGRPAAKKPLLLSEAIRRSKHVVYAPPMFFRIENNDIILHPSSDFKSSVLAYVNLPVGLNKMMQGRLFLPEQSHNSVCFRILIEAKSWRGEFEYVVAPGQDLSLSFSLPSVGAQTRITLETEMATRGARCDYAEAKFAGFAILDDFSAKLL